MDRDDPEAAQNLKDMQMNFEMNGLRGGSFKMHGSQKPSSSFFPDLAWVIGKLTPLTWLNLNFSLLGILSYVSFWKPKNEVET